MNGVLSWYIFNQTRNRLWFIHILLIFENSMYKSEAMRAKIMFPEILCQFLSNSILHAKIESVSIFARAKNKLEAEIIRQINVEEALEQTCHSGLRQS